MIEYPHRRKIMFSVIGNRAIDRYNDNYVDAKSIKIYNAINCYRDKLTKVKNTVGKQEVKFEKKAYSLEDMLTICFEFYKSLGTKIYENLNSVLNDENVLVKVSKPSSFNRHKDSYCNDKYRQIVINPTNDIIGLQTIVHELAHASSQRMKSSRRAVDTLICEVESLFMIKVFAGYLYENNIISQKEYKDLFIDMNNSLVGEIDYCFQCNEILDMAGFFPLDKRTKKELEYEISLDENSKLLAKRLKEMTSKRRRYAERYVVGEIVSTVLYDKYLKDREGTLETFQEYMSCNAELSYNKMMDMLLGMNSNKALDKFLEIKAQERETIEGQNANKEEIQEERA